MKFLFYAFFALLFCCCSSTPSPDLSKVSLNSSKGDVLHAIGNPRRTYVKEGILRWVYEVPDKAGLKGEKEVWFKDGIVVFVDLPNIKSKDSREKQIQFTPVD